MQARHRKAAGLFSLRVTGLASGQQQGFDIVFKDGIGGFAEGEAGRQDGLQRAGRSIGEKCGLQPWTAPSFAATGNYIEEKTLQVYKALGQAEDAHSDSCGFVVG